VDSDVGFFSRNPRGAVEDGGTRVPLGRLLERDDGLGLQALVEQVAAVRNVVPPARCRAGHSLEGLGPGQTLVGRGCDGGRVLQDEGVTVTDRSAGAMATRSVPFAVE
jgi:hypothetical protein